MQLIEAKELDKGIPSGEHLIHIIQKDGDVISLEIEETPLGIEYEIRTRGELMARIFVPNERDAEKEKIIIKFLKALKRGEFENERYKLIEDDFGESKYVKDEDPYSEEGSIWIGKNWTIDEDILEELEDIIKSS